MSWTLFGSATLLHFSLNFPGFPWAGLSGQDAGAALGGNYCPTRAFWARDGPMANSCTEYRRQAENCLRMAEHVGSPEAKSFLIMMASAWHRLAQDLENTEQRAERVDAAHASDERQAD
jgi:hypothetical protein